MVDDDDDDDKDVSEEIQARYNIQVNEVDNNTIFDTRLSLGYDLSFVCFFGMQGESNETRIKVANERAHQLLK